MIEYKIVTGLIILEFSLIILVIIASLLSKIITDNQAKKDHKMSLYIEAHLKELMEKKQDFQIQKFSPSAYRFDLIFLIAQKFPPQNNSIRSMILPLARIAATNNNWIEQFYAAQTFEIYAEKRDNLLIKQLVNHEVPIVKIAALRAALKQGVEAAIDDIIRFIKNLPPLTQLIYLQAFIDAPAHTRSFITKFFKTSTATKMRFICYKILLNYAPEKIDWDYMVDVNSKHKKLKLAALKLVVHEKKQLAIPLLIKQLDDHFWKTKVVVLHALGCLPAEKAIPKIIECLQNEHWWVRLNAAQALKNLGEAGEAALLLNKVTIEPKTWKVVRHVLKIL